MLDLRFQWVVEIDIEFLTLADSRCQWKSIEISLGEMLLQNRIRT